jgi:hypothetical protein
MIASKRTLLFEKSSLTPFLGVEWAMVLYSSSSSSLTSKKDAVGEGGEGGGVNWTLELVISRSMSEASLSFFTELPKSRLFILSFANKYGRLWSDSGSREGHVTPID